MGAHVSPHPESPTLLPPHLIPLGCPRAPDLSVLLDALNLHWSSILHMVIYMFQCYSLKSSHPRLLPQSSKVCSLRLCLFCYLVYKGRCYHLSKFYIYGLIYCIGVSLSGLLHPYTRLQFHPPHWNGLKCIAFYSWVIFHCVYVPQMYTHDWFRSMYGKNHHNIVK